MIDRTVKMPPGDGGRAQWDGDINPLTLRRRHGVQAKGRGLGSASEPRFAGCPSVGESCCWASGLCSITSWRGQRDGLSNVRAAYKRLSSGLRGRVGNRDRIDLLSTLGWLECMVTENDGGGRNRLSGRASLTRGFLCSSSRGQVRRGGGGRKIGKKRW